MKAKSSLLFLAFITNLFFSLHAQNNQIKIAFYNMENLFDTIDTPDKKDEEYLPSAKINWNTEKYVNKLANMSQSI